MSESRCSSIIPEEFCALLVICGFKPHGHNWFVKESSDCGPIYHLHIAPHFGCDGCKVTQMTSALEMSVDIRAPQSEMEFRKLCEVLGIHLEA